MHVLPANVLRGVLEGCVWKGSTTPDRRSADSGFSWDSVRPLTRRDARRAFKEIGVVAQWNEAGVTPAKYDVAIIDRPAVTPVQLSPAIMLTPSRCSRHAGSGRAEARG